MLGESQLAQYERDGYLVIRSQFEDQEIAAFESAYRKQAWHNVAPAGLRYPQPARYTLAKSCMAEPDLAAIAEHPHVLAPVETILGPDPKLSAFVVYDRTPDGPGIRKHNDYKRWRPVGSSMHWLFTIVPFTDYDAQAGQLFVSPGSHHLERVEDRGGRALDVRPPAVPDDDSFIDPELKRGDLLLMNMHCWHRAAPNQSKRARAGFFNKYTASTHPPATGYYVFNDAAYDALSDAGKKVMAVHSDKPMGRTRLLLQRQGANGVEFLLVKDSEGRWQFPGGAAFEEQAIPEWDIGNYIASLYHNIRQQVRIELPWVSYVGDYEEDDLLCRVYGFELNKEGFPVSYNGEWLSLDDVRGANASFGYEARAIESWIAPDIIRGKGVTQAQSRVDQYAY